MRWAENQGAVTDQQFKADALCAFLLPALLLLPITGLRIYVEHAGTVQGDFLDARTYNSLFYTVMMFANNHHQEHHMYPSVPSYKLPRVHKKLAAEGYYEHFGASIVGGLFAPLRDATGKYPYADGTQTPQPPQTARETGDTLPAT